MERIRIWAEIGQCWNESDRVGSAELGTKLCRDRPMLDRDPPRYDQAWPGNLARHRPSLGRSRPMSHRIPPSSANSGTEATNTHPMSAKFGPISTTFDRKMMGTSNFGECWRFLGEAGFKGPEPVWLNLARPAQDLNAKIRAGRRPNLGLHRPSPPKSAPVAPACARIRACSGRISTDGPRCVSSPQSAFVGAACAQSCRYSWTDIPEQDASNPRCDNFRATLCNTSPNSAQYRS